MAKLKNASKIPFYKTGPLYLHAEGHDTPDPSPVVGDKKKVDKDPKKHLSSFGTNKEKMNAKNPYPPKSDRYRNFKQLQNKLISSSTYNPPKKS